MTDAFRRDIASWALPERVAPMLAPGLPAAVAARLQRSPRLGARSSAWLAETLGDAELGSLSEQERDLVAARTDALCRAAILAGAVWHARRVAGLVLAADVAAFVAACGEPARAVAFRNLAAAVSSDGELPLEEAVARDGKACVTAWIDTLPTGVAARIRLMISPPDEVVPDALHRTHGPEILRRIAAEALA